MDTCQATDYDRCMCALYGTKYECCDDCPYKAEDDEEDEDA